jgi:hypothetical protein
VSYFNSAQFLSDRIDSKPPLSSPKQQALTRLISSFFKSILRLLSQLTNPQMITTCLTDSAKLVPYVVGNRKIVKSYLKTCLGLWSSPNLDTISGDDEDGESTDEEDRVRIAAFLSIRRVALGNDEALLDLVLKARFICLVVEFTGLTRFIGGIQYTYTIIQGHKCPFITCHQPDEEHRRGSVLDQSYCFVPACLRLHQTVGCHSEEYSQGKGHRAKGQYNS